MERQIRSWIHLGTNLLTFGCPRTWGAHSLREWYAAASDPHHPSSTCDGKGWKEGDEKQHAMQICISLYPLGMFLSGGIHEVRCHWEGRVTLVKSFTFSDHGHTAVRPGSRTRTNVIFVIPKEAIAQVCRKKSNCMRSGTTHRSSDTI